MSKTFREQFIEALKKGETPKAIFLTSFLDKELNKPYRGKSLLFWASRYGNEKVAQALREMGAVEVVDKEGMGDELIKILDAEDIDEIDEKTAIELIKDGANLEKKDTFGYTALIWASRNGHVEVVKALLDAGAKVNEKNNDSYTALIWASKKGHVEVVEALLDAGAKVNEKTLICETALMKASKKGHVEVVKTLISRGAKVDEKDNEGYTALIKASIYGKVEVVEALLSMGAKVDEKDIDGKTAIDYTVNDKIKKLLNEAMRKQKVQKFKNKISGFFGRE